MREILKKKSGGKEKKKQSMEKDGLRSFSKM
jgi:hypothetical protein